VAGGRAFAVAAVVAFVVYAPLFAFSVYRSVQHPDGVLINDVSRLNPTYVKAVVKGHELDELKDVLRQAKEQDLKVSIAGKRHSMGGHAFYPGAVVLDMTGFDQVLAVDKANKTVTVQAGATWGDVFQAINPYGLSVEVMQAYNGFTVGGAMSVNVHESDPNFGPLVQTVESFRLLLANGTVVNVSRTENPELFSLVIGGYGMFGVILDATLHLTDDAVYRKHEQVVDYRDYYDLFRERKNESGIGQIFARLSIAKDSTFLREMVVTSYNVTNESPPGIHDLQAGDPTLKKLFFGLSRDFDWGKKLRWYLQKEHSDLADPNVISRNDLMDESLDFLQYDSSWDTDILQEYFVPVDQLPAFIDDLRDVTTSYNANLLSATIRYLPVDTESMMSYSAREEFGVVLYFNVGTSAHDQARVQEWTRQLVDDAVALHGSFYLPYETYATSAQLHAAYANTDLFFAKKKEYDPDLRFMSEFYAKYAPS
jgi:FAD/FMN-containing dehydrogenase